MNKQMVLLTEDELLEMLMEKNPYAGKEDIPEWNSEGLVSSPSGADFYVSSKESVLGTVTSVEYDEEDGIIEGTLGVTIFSFEEFKEMKNILKRNKELTVSFIMEDGRKTSETFTNLTVLGSKKGICLDDLLFEGEIYFKAVEAV